MPFSVFPYTKIVNPYLLLKIQLKKQDRSPVLSSFKGLGTSLDWPWSKNWQSGNTHRPPYYSIWMTSFFVGQPNLSFHRLLNPFKIFWMTEVIKCLEKRLRFAKPGSCTWGLSWREKQGLWGKIRYIQFWLSLYPKLQNSSWEWQAIAESGSQDMWIWPDLCIKSLERPRGTPNHSLTRMTVLLMLSTN
jgi:hypothetical protein